MHASTRLRRLRRASKLTAGTAVVAALALPGGAAARPGTEVHQRSLHLETSSFATRGYVVNVETFGHHRVVLSAEKNGQLATYTVRGNVNRHRIRADSRSRRRDSSERTAAPRGWRPGGATEESSRRARSEPQLGQAAAPPLAISSSNRAPHSSHSNS